jgi:ferredoxin-thioredoxin reductase catalytic subunit
MSELSQDEIRTYYEQLKATATKSGYLLNPDEEFTLGIVESLIVNEKRYGYPLCPCRLSSGSRAADLDIICPCDYRDEDLAEYGRCYCALYVSRDATPNQLNGPIPERRPKNRLRTNEAQAVNSDIHVWRCRVCGYLCARTKPPEVCPICGAQSDRFELFNIK